MAQHNISPRPSGPVDIGGILLRAALILLCLILLCVHLLGNLYAKYATSDDGDDGARVAKFDVKVTGEPAKVTITCCDADSNPGAYSIRIQNESEVAVRYDITVTLSNAVPGVTPSLEDYDQTPTTNGDLTYQFSNVGTLGMGEDAVNIHILKFLVNWDEFTAQASGSSSYSIDLSFTVTIDIVQVD